MVTFPAGTDPERQGLQPTKAQRMQRPANYESIIGELRKNAAERLRVTIHEFNGHDMLSVRVYAGQDIGQARPTQKGLTMHVSTLPKLIRLLQEAEAKARAEGLIGS
jgi:Transcriptional Coactivator p15 (PC4)